MPRISLSSCETIKHRLTRARAHLLSLPFDGSKLALQEIAWSTYEFNRALKLPCVKHDEGHVGAGHSAKKYLEDALSNLMTVLEYPIHELDIDRDADEVVVTAQALLAACQLIPLPACG